MNFWSRLPSLIGFRSRRREGMVPWPTPHPTPPHEVALLKPVGRSWEPTSATSSAPGYYSGRRATVENGLVHKLTPTMTQVTVVCGRVKAFPKDEVYACVPRPHNACPRCFPDISERGWR